VTTATRRLRRASIAGLATIATAVAVVGAAGSAVAVVNGTANVGGGAATTVYPGTASQALTNVTLAIPNTDWAGGDLLTFGLSSSATALTPISQTGTNPADSASLGAVTATSADSGGATVAAPTITAVASGNSSVKDEFTVSLPTPPTDAGTTTFTFSGLSATLGTGSTITGTIYLTGSAATGTPFAAGHAGVEVGLVSGTKVAVSSVAGVTTTTGAEVPPTVTATDVLGGVITAKLQFALSGAATWTTLPTLTPPAGVTVATASAVPTNTLLYTVTGTTPANGVYTLTGGDINFGATAGIITVTALTGTVPAVAVGAATEIAFVGAQNRLGGIDRYATAGLIFGEAFANTSHATAVGITPAFAASTNATSVVVTSGANFPDALSSAYLASSLNTGILLTDPNTLVASTAAILTNGSINTVYIVGGTAAVSANVQNAITALHVGNVSGNAFLSVVRVQGADRYATNEAADLNAGVIGSGTNQAVIATGTNYADALAASPAIAKAHLPLILTDPATLSASAVATITALGVKSVIILGGTSAVSTAVETSLGKLPGVTVTARISGADRTLTAEQIALWETTGLAASGSYSALTTLAFGHAGTDNVDITNGANFPDALAAGPALAKAGAGALGESLLLTASPTILGAGIPALLGGAHATYSTVSAIGLAGAVSTTVLAQAGGSIS
jgi:ell wall binding domain 2 (CWB2)